MEGLDDSDAPERARWLQLVPLPSADAARNPSVPVAGRPPRPLACLDGVLLVEASDARAFATRRLLCAQLPGSRVRRARSLQEALGWLATTRFELVLTSPRLPDAGELETVTELARRQPETPLLVLEEPRDDGAGPVTWCQRDAARLERAIRHALTRRRYRGTTGFGPNPARGLTSRARLLTGVTEALLRAEPGDARVAVLSLTYGSELPAGFWTSPGARALHAQTAARFASCLRDADLGAREGPRELIAWLRSYSPMARLSLVTDRLRGAFASPFVGPRAENIHLDFSVGWAVGPRAADDALELLAAARSSV